MLWGLGCAGVVGVVGGGLVGEGTGGGEEEEGLKSLEEGTTKEHSELVVAENGRGLSVTVGERLTVLWQVIDRLVNKVRCCIRGSNRRGKV